MFQVGFNAAAQLEDPAPLSLQSCSKSLKKRDFNKIKDFNGSVKLS